MLPFATARPRRRASVAILGNAAGTTARAYGHFFPRTRVDGVEIDGALTDVGRRLFDLRGPDLHLHTADARPFLRRTTRRWDLIVVDAYRQPYIPFYLATRSSSRSCATTSRRAATVLVNVGHPERLGRAREGADGDDGLRVHDGAARPERATQHAARRHRRAGARRGALAPPTPRAAAGLPPSPRRRPRGWRPALRGGDVYTDDRAPVEWLIDASIVQVAAEGNR